MRFYKNQHQFYIGIDLHARTMYICVINNIGETVFHKNMECSRDNLELVTNTFGKDIVIGVECIFTWYWVADFCAENGIEFALGHAYYMKSIHGGKTKSDKIDSTLRTEICNPIPGKNAFNADYNVFSKSIGHKFQIISGTFHVFVEYSP